MRSELWRGRRILGAALLAGFALFAAGHTPDGPATAQAQTANPPVAGGSVTDQEIIAYINEQIKKGWADNGITPSAVASEYEFIRRVFLDIVGRIPTVEEIEKNVKNAGQNPKTWRSSLIQSLLKEEEYAQNWANLWSVWLLTRSPIAGVDREAMRRYLEDSFSLNKRYNKLVEELLTADGKVNEVGPANFIAAHVGERITQDRNEKGYYEMVPATGRIARLFLGQQVQCTQCHNHPFVDSRKQSQFWGINAYLRQVQREPDVIGMMRNQPVNQFYTLKDNLALNKKGAVYYDKRDGTEEKSFPAFFGKPRMQIDPANPVNRRKELTKLVVEDENFGRAIVNRMWAHYMGRGFTNPIDDFHENNVPSHPELLDRLGKEFVNSGYDLRRLTIWITNSLPYQLTSVANKTNDKSDTDQFFSRMQLKSMTPEQLVDSIFVATNAERTKSTKEERQKQYEEWLRDFTVQFGDDEGNEQTYNGTVVQALMLMNGQKLNDAIKVKKGSTLEAIEKFAPAKKLETLFKAALGRPPTSAETQKLNKLANANPKEPMAVWQDVFWALLNSNEFILNH